MGIRKAGEEAEEQQLEMVAASPEAGEQQPEEEDDDAAEQQQLATEDLFLMIGDLAAFYESELKESPASLGVDAAATAVFETGKQIAAAATQCLSGDPSQQTPLLYAFLSSLEKLTTRTLASIRADVSALAASPEETPARSSYINHKLKLLAMAFALQPPLAGHVECDLGPEIAAAMAAVLVQAVQFPVGPVLAELLPLCAHLVAIVAGALSQESGGAFSSAVMAAFNGQAPTLSSYAAGLIIMPYLEVPIDEGIQVFRAAFEQPAPLSAAMAAFAFMHLFIEASDRTVAPLPVVEELLPAAIACIFAQYFEEDFAPFAKKAFAWLCQFWNDGNSSELLESIAEHLFKVIQESVSRKYPPSTFIHEVSNLATLLASNVFLGQQFHQACFDLQSSLFSILLYFLLTLFLFFFSFFFSFCLFFFKKKRCHHHYFEFVLKEWLRPIIQWRPGMIPPRFRTPILWLCSSTG
ncbi:MAG: hypothetical protein Q8P67_13910 [archaeon]|nr:hypothetical protein [archaeon]